MKRIIPVFILILIYTTAGAYGLEPLEELKKPIDQVIGILRDPQYIDDAQKKLQHDKIWKIVRGVFDFKEIAKRTLARNWLIFTVQERKEFTDIFAEFLGDIYIEKIQGEYHNEQVVYLEQEMITASKAIVKTKILRETLEIPMDYRMLMGNGNWKIYDVNVEGVSLVKNYRTQFSETLLNETPAQLIERLREKIKR
ncbi:MAG: ABC transporter substrate-binding protein [Desulfobacterales bacterium]|nr:ABC transporter substrate-binding protein [Desulfobacterales bacterium]